MIYEWDISIGRVYLEIFINTYNWKCIELSILSRRPFDLVIFEFGFLVFEFGIYYHINEGE